MGHNANLVRKIKSISPAELVTIGATTGVPIATLMKIRSGETKNPRGATLDAIDQYFHRASTAARVSDTRECA